VQTIHQQTGRLRFMVERLLLLQTFDAATLRRAPLDVGAWLQQVVPAWEVRMAQAGLHLELETAGDLPPLLADPDFLEQVLVNLLDNAVKFSPDGGVVRVRAMADGERVVLAVSDQGIGMAPDTLARVFERFYQADGSRVRRFAGMGIGLALCTTIVEAHGGRMWAESAGLGQGSTFWVALPAGRSTAGETGPLDT
jgi:signal transduction histidine kinase